MTRLRARMRLIKCRLLIRYYRLRHVHPTAYVALGSDVSRDLVSGEYTYIGTGSMIGPKVAIGAYTMLGPGVMCLGDDHQFHLVGAPVIFSGRPVLRPTVIGRDAWIGARSIVLAGVQIGDGAVVAAGTVVSKSIPPCEVHGGVPNRKIKDRFATDAEKERHLNFLQRPPSEGAYPESMG